jgi:two-component system heavy metal sensor histidine kinase CusS
VLGRLRRVLIAFFSVAALVCWGAARLVVDRELKPLRQIAAAAAKTSTETLSYRIPLARLPVELYELARQFNDMLARLESAYQGLRQYADNIAHELRSPLNRMLLACEVTLLRARSIDEYRDSLESNLEECNRLARIVESVLFLARAEHAQASIARERFAVARKLETIKSMFGARLKEAGLTLSIDCPRDLELYADRTLVQRGISNLVANSIAHTPPGGTVTIRAAARGNCIEIEVADTGEGIAPEHLPRVFDRFYRADRIRSGDGASLGLGLPITKSIVELHGGTVALRSAVGKGTTIALTFPNSISEKNLDRSPKITESLT